MAAYQFFIKICRHWEEIHQNANGGYLWGRGLCTMVIFYFMLLCISSCLQRTWIACKIRKKTINVIKNEGKCLKLFQELKKKIRKLKNKREKNLCGLGATQTHIQIPDLTLLGCVNLSPLYNLSEPLLPHL